MQHGWRSHLRIWGTADKETDHYRLDAFVALNEIYSAIFDSNLHMSVAEVRRSRAVEKSCAPPPTHLCAASARCFNEANGNRDVGWGRWVPQGASKQKEPMGRRVARPTMFETSSPHASRIIVHTP